MVMAFVVKAAFSKRQISSTRKALSALNSRIWALIVALFIIQISTIGLVAL
jgi:hypothetical protein